MLAACDLPTTKSAMARSYIDYGIKLDPKSPVVGAIAIFPRGGSKISGHVGFISKVGGKTVELLNGNSSNMVRYTTFSRASIIGLSWPSSAPLPAGAVKIGVAVKPAGVLKVGSKGEAVRAYQDGLAKIGYKLKVDGVFGSGTLKATKEFQELRGLERDGVAGPATLSALKAAVDAKASAMKPLPDDRARKSTTIQAASTAVVGGAGTISMAVEAARGVSDAHKDAASYIDGSIIGVIVGAVVFAGGCFFIWQRLRAAGKLPPWLGGRRPVDNVQEAA